MIQLAGTGLLADDLYLLAHHDVSGRPFLQPRALGLGLAGGLLAELVLAGRVRVVPDVVVADRALPRDELACNVVGLLLGERDQHEVGDWLAYLARSAAEGVALRLAGSGYLVREPGRRLRRGARWVPADSDCAFAPLIRVRAVLDPARQAPVSDVMLAGLAVGCGLGSRVLPLGPPGGRSQLEAAVRQLGPDLRALIAQVQAGVDSAVLSQRM
jgi:Golgi phosphoprotein 3 (GPP34)